ncbi:hypothetical protein QQY24_20155 [Streptomyces sp. TG1A-8]|uniref:hypothetical protein n=1 Tax=Streptomyces sp. TG1A-8 TaxID=3051385 RepID=UPI00265BE326|nr:hypothetical protein [Streptomyces sp. TG1A-8]MDO0927612.1 hypothetical protein [Streptomyces sp. TG1A-8]
MDGGAMRRRLALGAALLAASGALALAVPADAEAATACAGREVRSLPFATGTVHLYKRDGYVCAVTVARTPGARRPMSVSVQARGNRPVVDRGTYQYRAGPVTVHAGHRCVRVGGSVGRGSVSSGWILC